MTRYTKMIPHATEEELQQLLRKVKSFWRVQQIQVIINAQRKPQTAEQLAAYSTLSKHRIKQLLRAYHQQGLQIFESQGQGGRKYGYLSLEEEKVFLEGFRQQAIAGKIVTTDVIQAAFEAKIGQKVARSTIYRLLKRHHWRKVVPRPYHPKKDPTRQEDFKKNSPGE